MTKPIDDANDDEPNNKTHARVMRIVFLNVSLYAVAFQLQRPIEPFLVRRLGADDAEYGKLQSFFSLVQSVGSPFVGALLDRVGARRMFVVVFASSAASYALLARATSIRWLYASKVPTVFQAGFLVAQALVAASTRRSAVSRAAALGRLTTAYTIGATLGPGLGGIFGANGDYYLGAKLAVAASIVSAALALALPEERTNTGSSSLDDDDDDQSNGEKRRGDNDKRRRPFTTTATSAAAHEKPGENSHHNTKRSRGSSSLRAALTLAAKVWPWLFVKTATGVTNSALGTTLPLALRDWGFDEKRLGLAMSGTAAVVAFVGAFCVGPLVKIVGQERLPIFALRLKAACLAFLSASCVFLGITFGRTALVALIVAFHASVSHVLATSLTTATTGIVLPSEQGVLLGIEHGLFAVARIFGPTLGTTLKLKVGIGSLAAVCAATDAIVALFFGHVAFTTQFVNFKHAGVPSASATTSGSPPTTVAATATASSSQEKKDL